MKRRTALWVAASAGAAAVSMPTWLHAEPAPVQRLGIFSLLGNSVRIVARDLQEVMFKDVGMDDIALGVTQTTVQARLPQAQVSLHRAPEQVSVEDQIQIGTSAGRHGELPSWVNQTASAASLSHVLIITSYVGAMEFRTARSEVVGNNRVSGIGFFVSADGRTTNVTTGATASGYLAPFVQLRLTLVNMADHSVVNSSSLSEGIVVGPPAPEAPNPWLFLDRAGKAQALQQLLNKTVARGAEDLFKPR